MRNMIKELNINTSWNNQLKWELLKYEIKRFTITYCKLRTKKMYKKESILKIN